MAFVHCQKRVASDDRPANGNGNHESEMKEQDLDKLFAQKLGARQFAFKEAYWDQMAGSMGGRRAGAWWIYLLLFLAIGGGISAYYFMTPGEAQHAESRNVLCVFADTKTARTSIEEGQDLSSTRLVESVQIIATSQHENENHKGVNEKRQSTPTATPPSSVKDQHSGSIASAAGTGSGIVEGNSNATNDRTKANDPSSNGPQGNARPSTNVAEHSAGIELLASAGNELPKAASSGTIEGVDHEKEMITPHFNLLQTNSAFLHHSTMDREFEASLGTDEDYYENPSPWSISVFAGVSLTNRELSGGSEAYLNKREKEETILPTWHGGIEAHYQLNNWQLSSGLNYLRIGEKTSYTPTEIEIPDITESYVTQEITTSYWVVDSLFVFNPDSMGMEDAWMVDSTYFSSVDTMQVLVADTTYTYEEYDVRTENDPAWFEYVEIPLLVGYGIEKNRWSFGIRGGVSLSILTGHGGQRVNQNLDALVVSEESAQLRKFMMNYHLRLSAGYRILPGTSIFVEPVYRSMASSVFKSAIDQRYRSYGINVGLLYNF
jgi:hypothetical protein